MRNALFGLVLILEFFAIWWVGLYYQAKLSQYRIDPAFRRGGANAVFLTGPALKRQNYSPEGQRILDRAKIVWAVLPVVWLASSLLILRYGFV